MVLGQHGAGDVDLAAADVSVQIDGARHDHLPGDVVLAFDAVVRARCGHDPAFVHDRSSHVSPFTPCGVEHSAALQPDHCRPPSCSRMRDSALAATDGDAPTWRKRIATTLSVRNRCPA